MEWDMRITEIKAEIKAARANGKVDEYSPPVCCSICLGDMVSSDSGCEKEVPYKLPCSHVFGSNCKISRALSVISDN